jgi:uncharacterized protein YdaU (DUF1376 family)
LGWEDALAEFPALPLWTDAWIADTKHLSRAERGMYFDLLVLMWRSPGCKVPEDRVWLHRRLNINDFDPCQTDATTLQVVCAEFCMVADGWLMQKRLSKEWAYLKDRSKRQSQNAKSRWNKEKDLCQTDASGIKVAYAPIPTPTPTPKKKTPVNSDTESLIDKSLPLKVSKIKKINGFHNGVNGNGMTQLDADAYAVQEAIEFLPGADLGERWAIAMSAEEPTDPNHSKSVTLMLKATKAAGVGWVSPERRNRK